VRGNIRLEWVWVPGTSSSYVLAPAPEADVLPLAIWPVSWRLWRH